MRWKWWRTKTPKKSSYMMVIIILSTSSFLPIGLRYADDTVIMTIIPAYHSLHLRSLYIFSSTDPSRARRGWWWGMRRWGTKGMDYVRSVSLVGQEGSSQPKVDSGKGARLTVRTAYFIVLHPSSHLLCPSFASCYAPRLRWDEMTKKRGC